MTDEKMGEMMMGRTVSVFWTTWEVITECNVLALLIHVGVLSHEEKKKRGGFFIDLLLRHPWHPAVKHHPGLTPVPVTVPLCAQCQEDKPISAISTVPVCELYVCL